jgi:hypothetical protein
MVAALAPGLPEEGDLRAGRMNNTISRPRKINALDVALFKPGA